MHMENTGELHGTKSQEHFTSPVGAMGARTLWSNNTFNNFHQELQMLILLIADEQELQ
jgi:hypothetical protein